MAGAGRDACTRLLLMNALAQLDAQCVAFMVNDWPITFGFGGKDYIGTCGARETSTALDPGGFHNDTELEMLVEIAQFGTDTRPGERNTITLCVDADGVPCAAADAVGSRVTMRIDRIGRSGGGLNYTLRTATRG